MIGERGVNCLDIYYIFLSLRDTVIHCVRMCKTKKTDYLIASSKISFVIVRCGSYIKSKLEHTRSKYRRSYSRPSLIEFYVVHEIRSDEENEQVTKRVDFESRRRKVNEERQSTKQWVHKQTTGVLRGRPYAARKAKGMSMGKGGLNESRIRMDINESTEMVSPHTLCL